MTWSIYDPQILQPIKSWLIVLLSWIDKLVPSFLPSLGGDVYQLADLLELKLETIGSGYVMTQNIKKGTLLKKNDYLGVELELPNEKNNDEDD